MNDVIRRVRALRDLSIRELKDRYAALFDEAPNTHNRDWLVKRLAWRIQALAFGGLTEAVRQRAETLARDEDLRVRMPPFFKQQLFAEPEAKPLPPLHRDTRLPGSGTVLTRRYKGTTYQVLMLDHGFQFQGQVYASLSAVAKVITGAHWNGFRFFGLRQPTVEEGGT